MHEYFLPYDPYSIGKCLLQFVITALPIGGEE